MTGFAGRILSSDDKSRVQVPRRSYEVLEFQRIGVFLVFLTKILAELTVRGVEIEPHVVLL